MIAVREAEGNRVVAVMNLSPYVIHADYYTGIYAGMYTDAMTGEPYELRGASRRIWPRGATGYCVIKN